MADFKKMASKMHIALRIFSDATRGGTSGGPSGSQLFESPTWPHMAPHGSTMLRLTSNQTVQNTQSYIKYLKSFELPFRC